MDFFCLNRNLLGPRARFGEKISYIYIYFVQKFEFFNFRVVSVYVEKVLMRARLHPILAVVCFGPITLVPAVTKLVASHI